MSLKNFALVLVINAACGLTTMVNAEEHQHHNLAEQVLQLNNGVKWPTDESLHTGMANIRQQLMLNLENIHYDRFSAQQYSALAKEFDEQVRYLFENCKLPVQADAQLHLLLARIMQGNNMMKSLNNEREGAVMIMQALKDYPIYFNDENWQKISH